MKYTPIILIFLLLALLAARAEDIILRGTQTIGGGVPADAYLASNQTFTATNTFSVDIQGTATNALTVGGELPAAIHDAANLTGTASAIDGGAIINVDALTLGGESASAFEDADAAITKSDEAEALTANWVNTNYPWGENEIVSTMATDAELLAATGTNIVIVGTVTQGVWNATAIADAYVTKTGAWTGTFDGQEGSYYLDGANATNVPSAWTDDTTYTNDLAAFTNAVRAAQTNDGYEADTDTTYTAGTNLDLVGTEFNLDAAAQASDDLADSALQDADIGVTVQAYDADLDALALNNGASLTNLTAANLTGNVPIAALTNALNSIEGYQTIYALSYASTVTVSRTHGDWQSMPATNAFVIDLDGWPTGAGTGCWVRVTLAPGTNVPTWVDTVIWPDGPVIPPCAAILEYDQAITNVWRGFMQ